MPIIHTKFTADPAPVVFMNTQYEDTLFLYTTSDAPGSDWFTMEHLLCYTTKDMVNWTDHGTVMSCPDFAWAKPATLWASQVIERNGKFYAYVPIGKGEIGPQIGVGIANSPFGPFVDAIGEPLIAGTWDGDIDPTVFIDDDGQAYMYWGNPQLKYVKLKENMIELDGPVVHVPMTEESFGKRVGGPSEDGKYPSAYEEGPWLYKREAAGNPYYLIYAGGKLPEHIGYSTAAKPEGPWEFGGMIMPAQEGTAFTIHPGIVDFKGRSYFFYHDQKLTALEGFTGGFTRSVAAEEFTYGQDGSIPEIPMTEEGPAPIAALDPYKRCEAETMNFAFGVKTQRNNPDNRSDLNMHVYDIRNGSYIKIKNVDFKDAGAASFSACVASEDLSGSVAIEIRLDSTNGPLMGTLAVANTGGLNNWKEQQTAIETIKGIHDLFLIFKGKDDKELLRMDYWKFT